MVSEGPTFTVLFDMCLTPLPLVSGRFKIFWTWPRIFLGLSIFLFCFVTLSDTTSISIIYTERIHILEVCFLDLILLTFFQCLHMCFLSSKRLTKTFSFPWATQQPLFLFSAFHARKTVGRSQWPKSTYSARIYFLCRHCTGALGKPLQLNSGCFPFDLFNLIDHVPASFS